MALPRGSARLLGGGQERNRPPSWSLRAPSSVLSSQYLPAPVLTVGLTNDLRVVPGAVKLRSALIELESGVVALAPRVGVDPGAVKLRVL